MDILLHPTPQFARPNWTDLCGDWGFAFDDNNIGLSQRWESRADVFDEIIRVPFPPESVASGINETGYHPIVWYRTVFNVDRPANDQRLILHFGAVDYAATVWVNGRWVGQHQGGHTPFALDITDRLSEDSAEQVIVVRAEDQPLDLGIPRGKQDWQPEPHVIWYHRTTGIWQPVWLEWVHALHIRTFQLTPEIEPPSVRLAVTLSRKPVPPVTLQVRLLLRGYPLVETELTLDTRESQHELSLPLDMLGLARDEWQWSPERPNLVDAELTLAHGDVALDQVQSYLGLRTVGIEGGRFTLNGQPYYLRMVLEQGYWPESLLAAPSSEALRREVEVAKELGFNGVRVHQKVEDPRYLYWCDRLGLAVWGEMANAYIFNNEAVERLTAEWQEALRRDYNHPCIITWVPLNESWGTPHLTMDRKQREFLRALYTLTKTFDSTRPVIDNDGWEHVETDILSAHDYHFDAATLIRLYGTPHAVRETANAAHPQHKRLTLLPGHRVPDDAPLMITEFGGISYAPDPGQPWHGYGTVGSAEEYLAKLDELISALLVCRPVVGFCYTQLTDTEQETNGLLLADREPKFDVARIRAIIQQETPVYGEMLAVAS